MRRRILSLAAVLLAAAGCDKEPAAQDARQADEALARDDLDSNDLTAIDAASASDSNMAADIDFTNMLVNEDDAAEPSDRSAPRRARAARTKPAEGGERSPAVNESEPPEAEDGAN